MSVLNFVCKYSFRLDLLYYTYSSGINGNNFEATKTEIHNSDEHLPYMLLVIIVLKEPYLHTDLPEAEKNYHFQVPPKSFVQWRQTFTLPLAL